MKTILNGIIRWVAHRRKGPSPDPRSKEFSPAEVQRLAGRVSEVEWQMKSLTERCDTLQATLSIDEFSLDALWEEVRVCRRASGRIRGGVFLKSPKKKTLN